MKALALGVFVLGFALFGVSLFLPANNDWLGFLWIAFAVEALGRGPQGGAEYPLFVLVVAGNLLAALAPFAFAGARAWGHLVAHLLVLATIGAVIACLRYHPATWAIGYYAWCAALAVMAAAIYLNAAFAGTTPTSARGVATGRPLGGLRRTR
jgi:hypothetical protein